MAWTGSHPAASALIGAGIGAGAVLLAQAFATVSSTASVSNDGTAAASSASATSTSEAAEIATSATVVDETGKLAPYKRDLAQAVAGVTGESAVVLATHDVAGDSASTATTAEELLGVHLAHVTLSRTGARRIHAAAATGVLASAGVSASDASVLARWADAILVGKDWETVRSVAAAASAAASRAHRLLVSSPVGGLSGVHSHLVGSLSALAFGPRGASGASASSSIALGPAASRWIVAEARAYAVGEDFSALHAALSAGANVKFVVATGSGAALQAASAMAVQASGDASGTSGHAGLAHAVVETAAAAAAELRLVKDVGLWALEQGAAFVASTAPAFDGGAQLRQALSEAAAFDGPALVLVFEPRASSNWASVSGIPASAARSGGVEGAALHRSAANAAVSAGAWPLYRWDPRLDTDDAPLLSAGPLAGVAAAAASAAPTASTGLSPALTVDSPCVLRDLEAFVDRYNQLSVLSRAKPEILPAAAGGETVQAGARAAHAEAEKALLGSFKRLASAVGGDGGTKKQRLLVLYGSDGGNAAGVAKKLADEAGRRGFETVMAPADDFDPVRLVEERKLLFVVSTAGQGEQPLNSKEFVSRLQSTDQPMLDHLEMAVVALGDSHYWPRPDQGHYYNKAGKDVFARLDVLGASPLVPLCLCDEQDDDGYEEALRSWTPTFWAALNVPDEDTGTDADDDVEAGAAPSHRSDEDIKRASNFLRGTLATSLEDPTTGAIPFEDTKLTKFAGIYMQDERDYRTARRKAGLEPAYSFMIRARMPGGVVTADQWLTFDRLADTHGNGTFKLTTRQAFQLHGVIKRKLKPTIKAINARLMDTIAACGDVNRNVMVSALPQLSAIHKQVVDISNAVSTHLKPHAGSRAYHEVFLDRKLVAGGGMSAKEEEAEPIYGPTYLPRKFKISFALPPVNDVDVYAHCLNFVAIVDYGDEADASAAVERKEGESDSDAADDELAAPADQTPADSKAPAAAASGAESAGAGADAAGLAPAASKTADIEDGFTGGAPSARAALAALGGKVIHARPSHARRQRGGRLLGFNVLVGGGMGTTHGNTKTFPRLAEPLCFVTPDQVIDVAEQCVAVQRDFGDRVNRKHARLKYTIDDRGIAWFRNEVETRLGWRLQEARPFEFTSRGDAFGWAEGEDGKLHLTLYVQNGRVRDDPSCTAKTALRKVAQLHPSLKFVLTANQNVVVSNVLPSMKRAIDGILAEHGVVSESLSGLRLNSVACVALPTCGLAMAESERYLPALITKIDDVLDECGLRSEEIVIRSSGCPNGCSRPFVAEVALVGKSPGRYNLYLGGGFCGQRLNKLYRDGIDEEEILRVLTPMLREFARSRLEGEHFGDFVIRAGHIKPTVSGRTFHEDLPVW